MIELDPKALEAAARLLAEGYESPGYVERWGIPPLCREMARDVITAYLEAIAK